MKLVIVLIAVLAAVHSASLPSQEPETRENEAILVDYIGMSGDNVRKMRTKINELLKSNLSNDDLTLQLYKWCQVEDPRYVYLVTIYQCKDPCYAGAMPSLYAIFDIDRNTRRIMVTGRLTC